MFGSRPAGGGSSTTWTFNACGDACTCALHPRPAEESLEELDFQRSACAAAQRGDVVKLERLLARNPDAVHADGAGGEWCRGL